MRIRTRILPFAGEKLVDVLPPPAAFAPDAPLRRLNYFPRRHLTDRALQLEQGVRVARLLVRAQGVSPGIVTGLECGLATDPLGSVVEVGTGYGLTASGDDVRVDQVMRVPLRDLPVLLPGGGSAPLRASATLVAADVVSLSGLAGRVANGSDAVAAWLQEQFSRSLVAALAAFDPDTSDPAPVRAMLVAELNALIQGDALEAASPFAELPLSPETLELLASRPTGRARERLNRMLLEDAFPLELARDRVNRLSQLAALPDGAAAAGVLVLIPGQVEELEVPAAAKAADAQDQNFQPFERVPADEAYYRRTTLDAARLVLLPLSPDLFPGWRLPVLNAPARWRNEVAWSVFTAEQRALQAVLRRPDEPARLLPWEAAGVAVGLVGLDQDWLPLFLDRHAVARAGGRPRQRVLASRELAQRRGGVGEPRLWQARVDQFAAELAGHASVTPGAAGFRWLPPFGVLPRAFFATDWEEVTVMQAAEAPAGSTLTPLEARRFRTLRNTFFPANYVVHLAAAPLEQLDAVAAATRGLDPFDLDHPDRVMVLAPVPQAVFDPQLLEVEEVAPAFKNAVTQLSEVRSGWLGRRADLRSKASALNHAVTNEDLAFSDPDKLDEEEPPVPPVPNPAEAPFGTTGDLPGRHASADLESLKADLEKYLKQFTAEEETELKQLKLEDYLERQKQLQSDEAGALARLGLRAFTDYLEDKVRRTDDLLDSGFLKLSADVYRFGQLLNNNAVGTKFATSEALATAVARPVAPASGAANLFTSALVANLAPAGIKSESAAQAKPTPGFLMLNATGVPGGIANLGAGAGSNALLAADFIKLNDQAIEVLDSNMGKSGYAKLQDMAKVDAEAQLALDALVKAGAAAATSEGRAQVAELGRVKQFAEAYVPNFNQITVKQIRTLPLDRLQPALAPQIRQDIQTRKLEIFDRLERLDISLAGLTTEFVDEDESAAEAGQRVVRKLTFSRLLTRRVADVLDPADADEAKHFAAGTRHADLAAAALRAVEARLKLYRELIARCRETLAAIAAHQQQVAARLHVVDGELAEARHDVAVAKALLAEEIARVAAVNQHRLEVLKDSVKFLVFHRPRAVEARLTGPVRTLHPALVEAPVPAALREDLPIPADLLAFQDVFRDSPARWFRLTRSWLAAVDQLAALRELVARATAAAPPSEAGTRAVSTGRYSPVLTRMLQQRSAAAVAFRQSVLLRPLAGLATASHLDLQREARERLTLRDFLDHGPAGLSRPAAEELERVFRVAAALHRDFSKTPGLLRLTWAEQFSQFDADAPFRDLSRLPRWGEVEFTLRRDMQALVDWIYSRVDAGEPAAVALMDDVVRVCLLLASHAPVDQIVTGNLAEPATLVAGGTLKIRVDAARVRLGMGVVIQLSPDRIVRAVVSNLTEGEAHAQIASLPANVTGQLPASAAVRFHDNARSF